MTWPLTPWYPASVKPVRDGVYLTRADANDVVPHMMFWNAGRWFYKDGSTTAFQKLQFAGLAFDPASVREGEDLVKRTYKNGDELVMIESGWWVPKP